MISYILYHISISTSLYINQSYYNQSLLINLY
nr:MAG TPA: hypothetical protein [Bacteriophage sp.]